MEKFCDDLKRLEEQVLQHPEKQGVWGPALEKIVADVESAYQDVIKERLIRPGRTARWLLLIQVGNDDFRDVYDTMWYKTIVQSERAGIEKYREACFEMKKIVRGKVQTQSHTRLIPLYQEAAQVKPDYDKTMREMARRFLAETGQVMGLSICPTLKSVSRIIEKSLLKATKEGDVSGVRDIVRFAD